MGQCKYAIDALMSDRRGYSSFLNYGVRKTCCGLSFCKATENLSLEAILLSDTTHQGFAQPAACLLTGHLVLSGLLYSMCLEKGCLLITLKYWEQRIEHDDGCCVFQHRNNVVWNKGQSEVLLNEVLKYGTVVRG